MTETRDTWGRSGNITVGLYSDETLKKIREGKDNWASTVFMNVGTFSKEEIRSYPYSKRKTFIAYLEGDDEPIQFYATDVKNAKRYLDSQYKTKEYPITELYEKKINYRRIKSYSHGGIVRSTGYAKLHKGELVIPRRTLQRTLKTDRGQGGWFRERQPHSIARKRAWRSKGR